MLKVVQDAEASNENTASSSLLDEIVRDGARQMLATALQAEVIALRVRAGLDVEAVARLVGRSPGAVRVAAHRGLRRLAQILVRQGVTL